MGTFLNIECAFNNTPYEAICRKIGRREGIDILDSRCTGLGGCVDIGRGGSNWLS